MKYITYFLIFCFVIFLCLSKPSSLETFCELEFWPDWLVIWVKKGTRRNGKKALKRMIHLLARLKKMSRERKRGYSKKRITVDDQVKNPMSELIIEAGWSEKEFGGIQLSDKRLNERLIKVSDQFGAHPLMPINQACHDWKDVKAAYRLFYNEKVTPEKILLPHQKRTQERMKGHSTILGVQDTTSLNYAHHPETTGLGPIGTSLQKAKGLMMHSTIAVPPEKLPLGLLTQAIWARAEGQEKRKIAPLRKKKVSNGFKACEKPRNGYPKALDSFLYVIGRQIFTNISWNAPR